jgi:hypothetical protein
VIKCKLFLATLGSSSLISTLALGQGLTMPDKFENLRLTGENAVGNTVRTYDGRYEGVKGHPYSSDEWLVGNVLLENEKEYQNVKLKYNAYQDQLIGLQQEKYPILLDKDKVRAFTMMAKDSIEIMKFVKAKHLDHRLKRVEGDQYVQVLHQGIVSLYALNRKLLNKANYRGAYNYGNKYDEFVNIEPTYYLAEAGEAHKLKLKKRKVIKSFDDHTQAISKYIENEHLELSNEESLLKVIAYYEKIKQ